MKVIILSWWIFLKKFILNLAIESECLFVKRISVVHWSRLITYRKISIGFSKLRAAFYTYYWHEIYKSKLCLRDSNLPRITFLKCFSRHTSVLVLEPIMNVQVTTVKSFRMSERSSKHILPLSAILQVRNVCFCAAECLSVIYTGCLISWQSI